MLQVTGVQFINTGLASTLAGLTQYNTAYTKMTQTVVNSTRTMNSSISNVANNSSKSFSLIGSVVNNFSNNLSSSTAGMSRFGVGLKQLILTMTGFILLKRIINDMFDSLRRLWDTMIEGASNTELLTIRFRNLVAISIQNTQGIDDYATALKMAQNPAQDLLDWVNVMAVKTIFSRDEVAQVLSLGMAFDMTAGQSMTLTKAMIDWASGMGLGDDALQRMVVNFGQMLRMGKVTQRELRDLAIGGLFPVNEALRRIGERAGLTGAALSDFMTKTATSGLPVNALLNEFVAIAGERFPDAGERMAKTWKGVTQNIKDFVTTILGASLLGPTMNKVVESLSESLDNALSPAVRGAASEIGVRLAKSLGNIMGGLKSLVAVLGNLAKALGIPIPTIYDLVAAFEILSEIIGSGLTAASTAIQSWIDDSSSKFKKASTDFFDWGFNIIAQFALGIVQGISTVLSLAMNVLASALEFFLGPGSPPRVAPNIDVWGTSAMNEYLKGMTKADFDILKDLQGPLQSALNVMAALGLIAKDQVGQIFYNLSKQIIAAMHQFEKTGKVSEALFASIHKAGGAMGDELEKLARLQFVLLAATKALEKAQAQLNDARKADTTAKSRVDALTEEYRNLVAAGASKDILDAKRAEIKAAMDERDQTRENVILAEDKVKAAEDAIDPLKEQVALQEQLVAQMIALAQAQVQANEAAGAGAGAGGVFAEMGNALAEFNSNMEVTRVKMALAQVTFENKLDETKRRISATLGTIFQPFIDSINQDVVPAIDNIKNAFGRLKRFLPKGGLLGGLLGGSGMGSLASTAGKIMAVVLGFKFLGVALGIVGKVLAVVLSPFAGLLGTIMKIGGFILPLLPVLGQLGLVLGGIGLAVGALYLAWTNDFLGMQTILTGWYDENKTKIDEIIGLFKEGKIKEALGNLGTAIIDWVNGINWSEVASSLKSSIENGLTSLFKTAINFGNLISDWFNSIDWTAVGKAVKSAIEIGLTTLFTGAANFLDIVSKWFNGIDWMAVGLAIGGTLSTALSTLFTTVFKLADWILTYLATVDWVAIATSLWTFLGAALNTVFAVLKAALDLVIGLVAGFIAKIDWAGMAKSIWEFLGAALEFSFSIIGGVIGGLLKKIGQAVKDAIYDFFGVYTPPAETGGGESGMGPQNPHKDPSVPPEEAPPDGYYWYWNGSSWVARPISGQASGGIAYNRGIYQLAEQGPEMVIRAGLTGEFFRSLRAMSTMIKAPPVSAPSMYAKSSSNTNNRYFNLNMATAKSTGNVQTDFAIMETLAG